MSKRAWVFTLNNPQGDLESVIGELEHLRYGIWQTEAGENGTPHYQGYLEFSKPVRMAHLKAFPPLARAHIEPRMGSREQARDYCRKEDTRIDGPFEWGEWNTGGSGKRNDVLAFKESIDSGKTDLELWDLHPIQYLRFGKALGNIRLLKSQQRTWEMEVEFFYGLPGSGKSRTALAENPNAYWKNKSTWWDGYTGQEVVVIDEFDGTWFQWTYLLKLMDRYPLNLEVKGGSIPFLARKIVFTSNRAPWNLYNRWKYPLQALFRRVSGFRYFAEGLNDNGWMKVASIEDLYRLVTSEDMEQWYTLRPPTRTPSNEGM